MKLSIMQPYFFPYMGYFQLIKNCDFWIFFDTVQYINRGWVNRNRVLHPNDSKEWQYITIPIKKHRRHQIINEIQINQEVSWVPQLFGKLSCYRRKAPYYFQTIEFLSYALNKDFSGLSEMNVHLLSQTCIYLDIPFSYAYYSNMSIESFEVDAPGDWALEISKQMGANEYINAPGGFEIFNDRDFKENNIELQFLKPDECKYSQRRNGFVPNLSIIDVMMWNSPEQIRDMLSLYNLYSFKEMEIDGQSD